MTVLLTIITLILIASNILLWIIVSGISVMIDSNGKDKGKGSE